MTGEQIGGTGTLSGGIHPAMLAPGPPEQPRRRGEGFLVTAAAVLGAIVVLGGLIGFQQWRSGRAEVAATATENAAGEQETDGSQPPPATEEPDGEAGGDQGAGTEDQPGEDGEGTEQPNQNAEPGPDDVEPPAGRTSVETVTCPAGYDAVICDAAEFVQQTRGRPFQEFPVVELLGDAEFDAALLADFEEYRDELTEDERVLKSLGLLPTELDLQQAYRELLASGVVGFYDPEDQRLVVRGGRFDLYGQLILVHELVHAFDDQWFDLDRDDFDNDDAEYGFSAVVEGNASRVEDQWRAGLSAADRAELTVQELSSLSLEDLNRLRSLPEVILGLQASPYVDGKQYVDQLFADGGEASVDQALDQPPLSSERVLNPGLDEDKLIITELAVPPTDGVVVAEGSLGQLLIGFWLTDAAADGWGGDRYAVWERGTGACIAIDLAADTATDLLELETAAGRWRSEDPTNRSVETVATAERTLLRVTGCY